MYLYPEGVKNKICYSCFVLQNNRETILVDSGLPSQDTILKDKKPFRIMEDAPPLKDALEKLGIEPSAIKKIILTHLHYDHCCNLDLFPEAEIYVQEREIRHALCPFPHEYRYYSLLKETGLPEWIPHILRFHRLEGEQELFEDVSVILTPGHSPGSQTVLAETTEGRYALVGDFAPLYQNYEQAVPNTIHTDLNDWYDSYKKLRAQNVKILPGHDMRIFDRAIYGK
ncbi:MAG: N-acyl homoserine lactonase family protein [Synergistaceae bacterium]|jgi:glyoxylase-like metal-dependent hydrolase (beta-lactamase superfamily II)|nr:N-acyl homoserine lactonase family protein [Synergistaceae bacterium]